MWVDDLDASEKTVTDGGGSYLTGREDRNPNTFYEVKYRDPDGIVFDITPTGWRGAVKEVVPADAAPRKPPNKTGCGAIAGQQPRDQKNA